MVRVASMLSGNAEDGPSKVSKHFVPFCIALPDFGQVVNPAIDLNDQACPRYGEIHYHAIDGVLAADGESVITKGAEGLPRDVFWRVRRFP